MRTTAELKVRDAMFAIIHEASAKIEVAETGNFNPDLNIQDNIRRNERTIKFNRRIIDDTRAMLAKLDLLTR